MKTLPKNILCFSHLRWDFVFQRPQHLLTRLSEKFHVYYLEEPVFDAAADSYLSFSKKLPNLFVGAPHLPEGLNKEEANALVNTLVRKFLEAQNLNDFIFWYYTPMALEFTAELSPGLIVYDCMDELSAFKFAPKELKVLESQLMQRADIVFTGGHSLYQAKKDQHYNIYPFPSSIDKKHFGRARRRKPEPADQAVVRGPKIGFYGVIDERFDIDLIGTIARKRPDWQIVLIGPVVKIDPDTLPRYSNIHYLGSRTYDQLPEYLSGWQVALIPFLLNESTRFISPTKTPEYLSGGIPVVSTPITDVVEPYGTRNLVRIASDPSGFIRAIEHELSGGGSKAWLKEVDIFLSTNSWESTCDQMLKLMSDTFANKRDISIAS